MANQHGDFIWYALLTSDAMAPYKGCGATAFRHT